MKRILVKYLLSIFLLFGIPTGFFHYFKLLPKGLDSEGKLVSVSEENIKFLYDLTYMNDKGEKISEQQIFQKIFEMIENAEKYILVDMFLFGSSEKSEKKLTEELSSALIKKKKEKPEIKINLITDPYNFMYMDSDVNPYFQKMNETGINIIVTDVKKLRDSNIVYSSIWRVALQWFKLPKKGWITNPLAEYPKKIGIRNFLALLNFKANHRKTLIADKNGTAISALVASANPHDASSEHSNIAAYFETENWQDLYESEKAVATFSNSPFLELEKKFFNESSTTASSTKNLKLQIITEGKIKNKILDSVEKTTSSDTIRLAMFYLSDRDVIQSLLDAAKREVTIEIILDPNKDAFGIEKNGIPNRQAAYELMTESKNKIHLRWYKTNGEQFHTKLLLINKQTEPSIMILGSANFTKRNIGNFNLETDIWLSGASSSAPFKEANTMFERIWKNNDQKYTADFEEFKDDSKLKYWIYRIQEASGMSTF